MAIIDELDDNELEQIRKAKNAYIKKWRELNPDYNKDWSREAYRKDPQRFKAYQK